MFTGIIEEAGIIESLVRSSQAARITVKGEKVLKDARLGDSIAVNGVCVTVVTMENRRFMADLSPETLKRSNLGSLKAGDIVNLERAMAADGRFGGHIVSGHIDGTAVIAAREEEDNSVIFTIRGASELMKYIAFKGSVAIDGISLTVAQCSMEDFRVSIIPFTLAHTTLAFKKPGDVVNIECDVIGKYVERLLMFDKKETGKKRDISMDLLKNNGFLT